MLLLSIIIPAYNVERYIQACLASCHAALVASGLGADESEVIVVDDGSTDCTPLLLSECQRQWPSLQVVQQPNQGQSVARNLAISRAKGRYIYMVDADDAMNPAQPLPTADLRLGRHDIIGLQVLYKRECGTTRPWSRQMQHWPFDREYATGADFVRNHNIEGLVYGYLFRRSLFDHHPELRFTPGIYHQDEELIFKIFTLAGPTIYRRGYTYIYYEHTGSSLNTHTPERRRKLMADHLLIMQRLVEWRDTRGLHAMMRYKLGYLAMDMLRMLIMQGYGAECATHMASQLHALGLFPLPWLASWRYLIVKLLVPNAAALRFWTRLHDRARRTVAR